VRTQGAYSRCVLKVRTQGAPTELSEQAADPVRGAGRFLNNISKEPVTPGVHEQREQAVEHRSGGEHCLGGRV